VRVSWSLVSRRVVSGSFGLVAGLGAAIAIEVEDASFTLGVVSKQTQSLYVYL
jgi:hypothetical protein